MQYTTNCNLKKPEGSDPVNIQDFNDNADTIDTELKKRINVTGGDISNTKINTAENTTAEFPVPAAGDAPKTFLGKMKKFTEDFRNLKTGLLTVGMLVNNCVTNNANLPLSAAQGKLLMDMVTQLNGERFIARGSVVAVKGIENDICSISLKAGHTYLLFGYANVTVSDPLSIMSARLVRTSGVSDGVFSEIIRTTMSNGGGATAWGHIICSTEVTVILVGYGYSAVSYNYQGHIAAIQLR